MASRVPLLLQRNKPSSQRGPSRGPRVIPSAAPRRSVAPNRKRVKPSPPSETKVVSSQAQDEAVAGGVASPLDPPVAVMSEEEPEAPPSPSPDGSVSVSTPVPTVTPPVPTVTPPVTSAPVSNASASASASTSASTSRHAPVRPHVHQLTAPNSFATFIQGPQVVNPLITFVLPSEDAIPSSVSLASTLSGIQDYQLKRQLALTQLPLPQRPHKPKVEKALTHPFYNRLLPPGVDITMGSIALTIPRGVPVKDEESEQEEEEEEGLTDDDGAHESEGRFLSSHQSATAPCVEMINGQLVVNAASLVVDTSRLTESASDTKKRRGELKKSCGKRGGWSEPELRHFFSCLRQVGTDFGMMATLFPTRTRKELKAQFNREEKNHPELVDAALGATVPIDPASMQLMMASIPDNLLE